jgi:hypothetical protein
MKGGWERAQHKRNKIWAMFSQYERLYHYASTVNSYAILTVVCETQMEKAGKMFGLAGIPGWCWYIRKELR